MPDATPTAEAAAEKKRKSRSPQYPYIGLKRSLERLHEFYSANGVHAVPYAAAVQPWGYNAKSSAGMQTMAALKSFGLMDYEGGGEKLHVKLSNLGKGILLDPRPNSPEKAAQIRMAALKPLILKELFDKYGPKPPADGAVQYYLTYTRGLEGKATFEEAAAQKVIELFKDTVSFAGLGEPDKVARASDPQTGGEAANQQRAETGSQQSLSGDPPTPSARTGTPAGADMKEDIFSLAEGDVILRWPTGLSAESLEDLSDWLGIVQKKIKRTVAAAATAAKVVSAAPTLVEPATSAEETGESELSLDEMLS